MATGTTAQQIVEVVTPAAGESVTEGTILEWHVKVGDFIKANDTIVEISTDKVDVELPSPASGTVTEILIEEGDTVTVGQVIARIAAQSAPPPDGGTAQPPTQQSAAADEERPSAPEAPVAQQPAPTPPAAQAPVAPRAPTAPQPPTAPQAPAAPQASAAPQPPTAPHAPAAPQAAASTAGAAQPPAAPEATGGGPAETDATVSPRAGDGAKVSPVAARAAAAEGVELAGLTGSGPAGRITKSDVLSAAVDGKTQAAVAPPDDGAATATGPQAETMRGAAAALARYMEQSRAIPTATSFRTITVTALDARRRELKTAGMNVSFTHLIAYAIARAADDMPVMSDHFAEIDEKPHRVHDGQVNLGLGRRRRPVAWRGDGCLGPAVHRGGQHVGLGYPPCRPASGESRQVDALGGSRARGHR